MESLEQNKTEQVDPTEDFPRISRLSNLFPVVDAMVAAAHSDRPASALEHETIEKLMCELMGVAELPSRLQQRIHPFDPGQFNLPKLAEELVKRPIVGRRRLIERTRKVSTLITISTRAKIASCSHSGLP